MKLYKTKITKIGLVVEKILYRSNKPMDTKEYLYLTDDDLDDPAIKKNLLTVKGLFGH